MPSQFIPNRFAPAGRPRPALRWLAAALLAVAIGHTFNYDRDYHIPAEEVERVEAERTRMLASHV